MRIFELNDYILHWKVMRFSMVLSSGMRAIAGGNAKENAAEELRRKRYFLASRNVVERVIRMI